MLNGFTRKFKPLEILTDEQVEDIHKATIGVLWKTGVVFHHKRALKLFEKNGCKVDFEKERVYFPPGLVEECLRRCPSNFYMNARNPKKDLLIGGDTVYFSSAAGMETLDLNNWEPRIATRKENYDSVTVLDALDNHHFMCCYTPYFGFEGVPPVMSITESVAAQMRNSDTIQHTGNANDCEIFNIRLAQATGTEITAQLTPSPPLTYYSDVVENAFRFTEAGFPIDVVSSPIFGGTGPATIAGSMVSGNSEVFAGIVLVQLLKPGSRVFFGNFTHTLNMRQGSPAFGDIGVSLSYVVSNQIFRKYKIPIITGAIYPSSKKIDFQCGYEKAIPALLAALSGSNIIYLYGSIYGELAWHPLQAILDDDIAGMVGRFIEGVTVNDETLAIDLINEVGPIPGDFLNTAHTRKWWKNEQYITKAADRSTYPEWIKEGKKDCLDYAKERMEEILSTHKVSVPLTQRQEEDVESILTEARKYYRDKELISDQEWEDYKIKINSPKYPFA